MAVELKPHNKEAYEKVLEGFKNKNRVAVIEPPGTGKSFIALKWLEDNKDKRILLLVPSYSIVLQYEEHMKACGYTLSDFSNLTIMTYSTLLSEVKNRNVREVEGIILDEFHRCGAPEWGKGVETLLEKNKNAKILGLSATPIRFLDKNRDMSDELFDGNIVFQMDLTEAVARSILHFPLYINGIYQLDADIKRYEKKINTIVDESYRKTVIEKLELAKRKLEQAEKLDELFFKYMKKTNSKNIIFCKDKKHMNQMIGESYKWFSKVNPEIDIYSVYYGKKNNEEELKNFYNSNNEHLKLLFCIDMLNEGFHDPNIDNIIMLRPTISPILFIQQLGRGLALGNHHVTIYDIVNNSRSNKDIKVFLDKVRKKRNELIENHKIEENIEIEDFEIVEEVREVFAALNDIENMLQSFTGKEYKIQLIEEFYQKYHRLPKVKEKYKNIAIGTFLNSIKQGFIKLTEEQKNRLLKIGFILEVKDKEEDKEYKICLIEEFYQKYNRLPKQREKYKNIAIGNFLFTIKRKHIKITEEQMNRLVKIGFEMKNKEQKKEEKICLIEEFYFQKNRLPKRNEKYQGVALGTFLNSIKQRNVEITEEQKNRLLKLGFQIEVRNREKEKEQRISLLEEFYQTYKRLPYNHETYQGIALGAFLSGIKREEVNITKEQMERLTKLGFRIKMKKVKKEFKINTSPKNKEVKIRLLEEFYMKNKRLPYQTETYEGIALGAFLRCIKRGETKITEEQMERLTKLGFSKKSKFIKVEQSIKRIEEFYQKNKRLPKAGERFYKETAKVGDVLLEIKCGKIRITEEQLLRLQKIDTTLTREQVSLVKPKVYVKK